VTPVLLRAAPWPALLALSATGVGTGVGAIVLGLTGPGVTLLQTALILLGGAAACALDEPAAAVVQACPVRRHRQLLARAIAASLPLAAGGVVLLAWAVRTPFDRVLLLELAGCWLLGFALASGARRRLDEPAEVVAPGLVLGLLAVLLIEPLGRRLELFALGGDAGRAVHTWLVIGVACLVVLLTGVRERRWARKDG